ncbi:MAG: YggT family protein [Actinobacteria bacterium]|nr:YggT family protein [Actinomycetota bacterium]
MAILLQIVITVLTLYMFVLIGRLVFDWVQVFSRNWEPTGPVLLVAESVYTVTDPPINFLRRFIPPLKIGQVALDLSFLVLIIGITILLGVLQRIPV